MSTHTYQFNCTLPQTIADALNHESARIYNAVMVEHWRIYRKKGVWIQSGTAQKLHDLYDKSTSKLLYSHSIELLKKPSTKPAKQPESCVKMGMRLFAIPISAAAIARLSGRQQVYIG